MSEYFKYLLVDEDGEVTGTNSASVATAAGDSDRYLVTCNADVPENSDDNLLSDDDDSESDDD